MAELVDALDLGSSVLDVRVRVSLGAQTIILYCGKNIRAMFNGI